MAVTYTYMTARAIFQSCIIKNSFQNITLYSTHGLLDAFLVILSKRYPEPMTKAQGKYRCIRLTTILA